jgi:XRE family transcriptional regulator, fatty acid utilization regulator
MDLRIARKIAGLTQQELAERAGVTDSFISLIEHGKRDIRTAGYETVVRLARALGVEPEELWPVEPLPIPIPREGRDV